MGIVAWFRRQTLEGKILRHVGKFEAIDRGSEKLLISVDVLETSGLSDRGRVRIGFVWRALLSYESNGVVLARHRAQQLSVLLNTAIARMSTPQSRHMGSASWMDRTFPRKTLHTIGKVLCVKRAFGTHTLSVEVIEPHAACDTWSVEIAYALLVPFQIVYFRAQLTSDGARKLAELLENASVRENSGDPHTLGYQ